MQFEEEFITVSQEVRALRPILQHWIELQKRYIRIHGDDAPWWYNERASVSLLAGAACQVAGWIALEEYRVLKKRPEPSANEQDHSDKGRCDLYMASLNTSYACEAKLAWQNIGTQVEDKYAEVKFQQEEAWDDVAELHADEADLRLAVCFVAPRFPETDKQRDQDLLEQWAIGLARMKHHALAWYFPTRARSFLNEDDQKIYPGNAVLFRIRKRGARRLADGKN